MTQSCEGTLQRPHHGVQIAPSHPSLGLPKHAQIVSCVTFPVSLCSTEGLGGSLVEPQELDRWLVGTVRAMQESMRDVQRRLQSLESKPQPLEQVSPSFPSRLGKVASELCSGLSQLAWVLWSHGSS